MNREISVRCNIESGVIQGRHIDFIDVLKGFAIILVVIEHVVNGYLGANTFPQANALLWGIDNVIYGFHMELFMMLSGYLFSTAYLSGGGYVADKKRIRKKVLNHLIVYFVFSLIYALVKIMIEVLGGISVNRPVSWLMIATIPIKPIDLYWYLYVLILCYLIFSLKRILKAPSLIVVSILFPLSACGLFIEIPWFSLGKLLFYAFFFYLGILKERRTKLLDNFRLVFIFSVAAVMLFAWFWKEPYIISNLIHYKPIVSTIVGLGGASAVWYIFEHIRLLRECRFLKWLGTYTLEIYLIHIFISAGNRFVFSRIGLSNVYLCMLLNVTLSLLCPLLIAVISRKLGLHRLLFQPVDYFTTHLMKSRWEDKQRT